MKKAMVTQEMAPLIINAPCTNRPLHNEHENVICAKKSKIISNFWAKNESRVAKKKSFSTFFEFWFSHVFFIKVLNITLADQNGNMPIFYQKIPKLNYIHLKLFFGGLVQTLQFFLVK